MATTTNFGWETPDDTDLVKDGALAIRTLGNSIDTSLVDLKGGTTGQVLSKTSNTDMDFTWVTSDDANAIQNAIVDAKGDLITATAADTPSRLAVGTNGQVLTADSTTATGLKWAAASSGLTLIKTASFSNVADTGTTFDSTISSDYDNYIINFNNIYGATGTADFHLQFRYGTTTQATNYQSQFSQLNAFGTVTQTLVGTSGASQFVLSNDVGATAGYGNNGVIEVYRINGTDSRLMINWRLYNEMENTVHGGGFAYQSRTYTGFLLKASTGNIYGTVSIYGQAK